MTTSLMEQVQVVVADVLGTPVDRINEDTSQETLGDWDSLAHLNIVLSLESRFGVKFSPAEIEQIRSVRAIVELLESKPVTLA